MKFGHYWPNKNNESWVYDVEDYWGKSYTPRDYGVSYSAIPVLRFEPFPVSSFSAKAPVNSIPWWVRIGG